MMPVLLQWLRVLVLCPAIFLTLPACDSSKGSRDRNGQAAFSSTRGTEILDREGQAVVMRGLGLGGWLMPEGYMLRTPGFGSPATIRDQIEDLIGPTDADRFFEIYESEYVKRTDVEGDWYATDFAALTPAFDDNMVWAFHKYWNSTDASTIAYALDLRRETNRPVWLGESGENSNDWFFEVTRMVEGLGIGWNWWTHKKIGTITSPLSAPKTEDYERVLAYLRDEAPRPSADFAREALFGMARRLDIARRRGGVGVLRQ